MLACSKCGYEITSKMRYCLIKNFCPSCGNSLLSEENSEKLKQTTSKLKSKEFINSLYSTHDEAFMQLFLHDLSIFICFEMNGEELVPAGVDKVSRDSEDVDFKMPKKVSRTFSNSEGSSNRVTKPKAISRVRSESEEDDDEDIDVGDDEDDHDQDERVRRLKEVYKKSVVLNKLKGSIDLV